MTECDCGCGNEVGDQGFYSLHVIGAKNMYDQLYQEHKRTIDYYENRIVEIAKLKEEIKTQQDKIDTDYSIILKQHNSLEQYRSTLDEIITLRNTEDGQIPICNIDEILAKHEGKQ
jgi:predicted  nucleic acid-binding Zn-ribbon protein